MGAHPRLVQLLNQFYTKGGDHSVEKLSEIDSILHDPIQTFEKQY
jgi:hypothetical protein